MNTDDNRPLIIIGFMAAGKSTAAAMLGNEFDLECYDTDQLIQKRLGCSISAVFANSTEAYFREVENEVFAELMNDYSTGRKLIATGGGLPLDHANEKLLRLGTVIFINTAWQEILGRISSTRCDRPVAAALNDVQLHALWLSRCEKYEEVADYVVTDYDSLKQCISSILTAEKRTQMHKEPVNTHVAKEFMRLVEIMEVLRSPEGCAWDRKQTHQTLAKFVLEEANEVVEAIESGDSLHVCEELGDLLMLIVFNSQLAKETGVFDITDVCKGISDKLVSRHPHVFDSEHSNHINADEVIELWGKVKTVEKANRSKLSNRMKQALEFPSAIRAAEKIQAEAAGVGFDFPSAAEAFKKIKEEVAELEAEFVKQEKAKVQGEIGDILFSVLNVSRLMGLDAEQCLKQSSEKFVQRFSQIEELVEKDGGFEGKTLKELDHYWDKIKEENSKDK